MDATACIKVSGLSKSYGDFAVLEDLSLSVQRGSVQGLVGLNGSGKTTTLSCLLGMLYPDAGEIRLLDLTPGELHKAQGKVVAVFDAPSLHPHLSVRQTLEHARMLCPRPSRTAAEVEALLGLERYSDFRIRNLSLGNRRRASIAHALLGNPELIILDEPFNGLDAGGVDDVLSLIDTLNREAECSFLLSSHQLPYLERVCSHLAVLHKGRIVRNDSVDAFLAAIEDEVLVRTLQVAEARQAIDKLNSTTDTCLLLREEGDSLHIALKGLEPWQLNAALVEAGIRVAELRLQQRSLESVFRQLTSGDAA